MRNVEQNNNRLWLWVLYLIYPLGALIYAVKNYDIKKYRIFILLFFCFYGFTFLPIPNSDGSRYKEDFETTRSYDLTDYSLEIQNILEGNANNPDFYAATLKYVAYSLSSSYRVFFLLAALFYFLVVLALLETIWESTVAPNGKYFVSFFIGCCFIYNFSAGINSVRFPFAFMIFAYGALQYVLKKEIKFVLIACLSVLVHFSLAVSCIFLILYVFVGKRKFLWSLYIVVLLTFIFSSVFPSFINQYVSLLGSSTADKLSDYTQEGFVETRDNHLGKWNWYVLLNFYSSYLFAILSIFSTRIKAFKVVHNPISDRIFIFTLFMYINALLSGSLVDVISNRFNLTFTLFALIYMFYISKLNTGNRLIKFLNYVYIPVLILNILVKLRADLYTVNSVVVLGNVVSTFFLETAISIQDLIL